MALHDVLAPLWARARVDNLMNEDYAGAQSGNMRADLKDTITQLGIEYRLMTQFTSFVAVEEMVVTDGGQPRRIEVPVETPEGVKGDVDPQESIVNIPKQASSKLRGSAKSRTMVVSRGVLSSSVPMSIGGGAGGGVGPGRGGNMGSGSIAQPGALPSPNSPPARADAVLGAMNTDAVAQSVDKKESDELRPKLHPSLLAVVEKLQRKETLTAADEHGFIRNGKAEVQVWLSDKSPASIAKLKQLGFEVVLDAKSSKLIIGRLPVEKLETLARLDFVKYVSPQITK
jgi:hypothetical protein